IGAHRVREARPRLVLLALMLFATLISAPPAQAQMPGMPESLTGSCQSQAVFDTGVTPYAPIGQSVLICDDAVPVFGGDIPNEEGARAVKVPAKYAPMVGGFGLP